MPLALPPDDRRVGSIAEAPRSALHSGWMPG